MEEEKENSILFEEKEILKLMQQLWQEVDLLICEKSEDNFIEDTKNL